MTTAVEVAEKGHQLAAWVNFNGTLAMDVGSSYGPDAPPADYSSPNPIRAAYNVESITDNGTGDYTVNFENDMPDAKYSWIGSAGFDNYSQQVWVSSPTSVALSTWKTNSRIRLKAVYANNTVNASSDDFSVVIFR